MKRSPKISKHANLEPGTRYEHLVTEGKPYPIRRYATCGIVWEVKAKCDCGKKVKVLVWQLKAFKSKSCGCMAARMHTAMCFRGKR